VLWHKKQPKAIVQADSIEDFQRIAKVEEARPVPPGNAYITSRFGNFNIQSTGCHIISMQTCIEAMEREKQHAREKAGHGDICEQPMIAVITAAGKMLFCTPCLLSLCVLDCSAVKALQHQGLCGVDACMSWCNWSNCLSMNTQGQQAMTIAWQHSAPVQFEWHVTRQRGAAQQPHLFESAVTSVGKI